MNVGSTKKNWRCHNCTATFIFLVNWATLFCPKKQPTFLSKADTFCNLPRSKFRLLGKQLLQKLYGLYDEFSEMLKPRFFRFMFQNLAGSTNEGQSINLLYLSNMRLFSYNWRNEKNSRMEQAAAQECRLVFYISKTFREDDERCFSARDTIPAAVIRNVMPTQPSTELK